MKIIETKTAQRLNSGERAPEGTCLDRRSPLDRLLGALAPTLTVLGLVCMALFTLATFDSRRAAWAATSAFEALAEQALAEFPDQTLWSDNRRADFLHARAADLGAPPGLIRIPAIDLTVPVFEGTDELVLNRGAGWIEGTAALGGDGNIGIAGHRDGFFRGLKDLEAGDAIEISTIDKTLVYRITEFMIVEPHDVYVLDATTEPALTLVTCYPFYFVGHAPQRYIVRAVLDTDAQLMSGSPTSGQ